ncbi:MAG: hypothetical protein ACKVOO_03780 [Burkholderiaceae bacterium]
MNIAHFVESYRFWDIAAQWGRETLQHEHVIARALARGLLRDGLRLQSVDPKWERQGSFELRGQPLVGYVARPGDLPIFIRASALKHLQDVTGKAATPNAQLLFEEFITQQDFGAWLKAMGIALPAFWFAPAEHQNT